MLTDHYGLIISLLVALGAGLIRGFTGFGGPAFMLATLTWIYSPLYVIGKVLIVEFIAASYLVSNIREQIQWRTTAIIAIPTMLTMPLGHWFLENTDPILMRRLIAGTILLSCLVMSTGYRYRRRLGTSGLILLGLIGGLVFGASYIALLVVSVLMLGPYNKGETRGLFISWGFLIGIWYVVISVLSGNTTLSDVIAALPLAMAYFTGTITGAHWFKRSTEHTYRRYALITLMVLSVFSLVK